MTHESMKEKFKQLFIREKKLNFKIRLNYQFMFEG